MLNYGCEQANDTMKYRPVSGLTHHYYKCNSSFAFPSNGV
ncbi:hypothetical protein BFV94_0653 [Alteromonas macleodii]|uniref:Uncharacterized protein n=1 Tax=Alteromonas macleodii TaxID=28108 RepID=A0AB36FVU4_ALTMA|nr:hypothetical protein BFV95_0651 [Alteromonas macleodii]OES35344.1 hypothetical protein BFV94_0653 [Alteromonas macleodii]OES37462.1 hypothetical protein BFV93_0651 [Alteromonas macleodii]OES43023.1 hypothetical protein BFV96_0653 [Alteromonas macleodii]